MIPSQLQMKKTFLQEPWKMLIFLLLAQLLVAFIGRSVGPLGVLIGDDLSLNKSQIGMLPAALFLGQALASIPVGFVVDQIGSKKFILIITSCIGISFIMMTFSHHFGFLLILVMIGGLGYGAMHPVTNRGIIYWFHQKQRGVAMGIKQTGITTGSALAGLVLLPLAGMYGWRPVIVAACLLVMLGGFVSYSIYHDNIQQNNSKTKDQYSFFASMKQMMKNKPLMLVSLCAMGLSGSQLCLVTYIVIFSYEYLHLSLFLSGVLLVLSEVFGSIGRIIWGIVSDRIFKGERVIILVIISVISGISSFVLAILEPSVSFGMMVPIVVVFGFAISGFNAIWMNVASEVVESKFAGLSSGFSITLGSIGVVTLPPLFGFVVDLFGNFTAGWIMIVFVMVVVFVLLLILKKMTIFQLRGDGNGGI